MQTQLTDKRNKWFFGLGTIGRDMFYSMESMFLTYYLTEVLDLPNSTMALMTVVLTVLRIFDAFNDPVMGVVVDNTKSRWGKFKPGIVIGAFGAAIALILMFTDLGLKGWALALVFGFFYLSWDIFYGWNDIAYWSMLPSLSTDQKAREKIGAVARNCANIGLFAVVVLILPATSAMGEAVGSAKSAWFIFAVITSVLMLGFLCFTVFGVKEKENYFKQEGKTSLSDMFRAIGRNDQLLWVVVSMSLFMIGYMTTTSFGTYYFKYVFRNEGMYSAFAAVLGVSQIAAIAVFPTVSKSFSREKLFAFATGLVALGYIIFFLAPLNMIIIGAAAVLLFVGEAFIQILMLMFLADTIEYGQWKLGKRNESVTFSVQPLINKLGAAIANGVVMLVAIISGINEAASPADVTAGGIFTLKGAMMIFPLAVIAVSFFIYRAKYKIDAEKYSQILAELKARGDIRAD
ncbi:MAG: glycoside-pentoside-hexuronide (GPH):cation symporter [Oscillospiraceae bacterium]|jgi:melibiose permease/lactose/raffinose/galactose permease|nr:glycoside-pentoside-hexuronide (GPH):cation symporter [Oscillospiraceae bacterium]